MEHLEPVDCLTSISPYRHIAISVTSCSKSQSHLRNDNETGTGFHLDDDDDDGQEDQRLMGYNKKETFSTVVPEAEAIWLHLPKV